MESTFFPKSLVDLYKPDGIEYRIEYNKKIWDFISQHQNRDNLTQYEKRYIELLDSMPYNNILVPCEEFLQRIEAPFDVIAVSFEYVSKKGMKKNVAIMEYYSSKSPVQQGCGKTGLALALLGVDIPYDKIPHPKSRDDPNDAYKVIAELDKKLITPLNFKKRNVKLITSDLMYIGVSNEKIYIAQAVGEPFIAQWDTARHISRVYNTYYKDDTGKTIPWLKEYLTNLAEKYYLKFGNDSVFTDPFSHVLLDEIYIIQQRSNGKNAIKEVPEAQTKKVLESLLFKNPISHPAYPKSAFWKLYEDEHKRRVQHILNNLTTPPHIRTLDILTDNTTNSEEAVNILKETLED